MRGYFLLFTLISIILLSCTRSTNTDPWSYAIEYKVIDPNDWEIFNGDVFRVKYPADWTNLGSFDEAEFVLIPPSTMEQITTCNVTFMTEETGLIQNARKYADKSLEQIIQHYTDIIIEGNTSIRIGEIEAVKLLYTFNNNGTDYKIKQALFINNGMGYVLTFGGLTDDYSAYESTFDSIMCTIQFR